MTGNVYFLGKQSAHCSFAAGQPPVLTVAPGDTVTFETDDGGYELLRDGKIDPNDHGSFNRVTGPVAIAGAEPGDALVIEILDIEITRIWAPWFPDYGAFQSSTAQVRQLSAEQGMIRISPELAVPMAPMIGCIGLAPATGESSTYAPAYPWGGNMDLPELCSGAVLLLPVQAPGGLLSVGDLHAAMGRGEPLNVGLEAGGRATLRLSLEKNRPLRFPRIRSHNLTLCVGIGETPDEARNAALAEAREVLFVERGLPPLDAFAFAAATLGLRFGGPATEIVLAEIPDC